MKFFRKRQERHWLIMVCMAVLLFGIAGVALASGGEESLSTEHQSAGEGHAAVKGWIATDTYRVMNFAVLAGVLFFLLRKPTARALRSRIEGIRGELNELEAKKKEAEAQLAEYNERIALLDQEVEKVVAGYIAQGKEAAGRILKEAEAASAKLEQQAQRSIENEFKQAKLTLQEDILEKALVKAEEMIKSKITPDDQSKLVDEYLDKVVLQ